MTGKIFISYRRADSEGYAGRIYDRLSSHFGRENIFMDVDMIEPGVDFVDTINKAIETSDAVMILIGKRWLNAADAEGMRRLDKPQDFVRLEVAAALQRDIRVIPVLVGEANMPKPSELPEDLASLTRRNAIEVTHARFNSDMDKLVRALESALDYSNTLRRNQKQASKKEGKASRTRDKKPERKLFSQERATPEKKVKPVKAAAKKRIPKPVDNSEKGSPSWLLTRSVMYLAAFVIFAGLMDVVTYAISNGNANVLRFNNLWGDNFNGMIPILLYGWLALTGLIFAFPRKENWTLDRRKITAGLVGGVVFGLTSWMLLAGALFFQSQYLSPYPLPFYVLVAVGVGYYFGPVAGLICGMFGSAFYYMISLNGVYIHWMVAEGLYGLIAGLWRDVVGKPKLLRGLVWITVIILVVLGIPGIGFFAEWATVDFGVNTYECAPSCGWMIYIAAGLLLLALYVPGLDEEYRTPGILGGIGVGFGFTVGFTLLGIWFEGWWIFSSYEEWYTSGFSPTLGWGIMIGMLGLMGVIWSSKRTQRS